MSENKSDVFFASAIPERVDRHLTLPACFQRLLAAMPIAERIKGKTVCIKMHLGGDLGYSTIHPLFVKLLVDHVKRAKPADVFITDGGVGGASDRGYTRQTLGARLVPALGKDGTDVVRKRLGWEHLKSVKVSKPVLDADILINLSHVKGHGDCAFGGACKNLAMGCVPGETRRDLHRLEGELHWEREKCIRCNKCIDECDTNANSFDANGEYQIFWHHCRLCRHCQLVCPVGAISIVQCDFDLFQEGLARVAHLVVRNFRKRHVFHINVLTHITIFCDCWGMTTPALVPDVGIFGSEDIVAVEDASLRAIKAKNVIPGSITPPFKLGKGRHLFEKIHARDPFIQVRALQALGAGSTNYRVKKIR